MAECIMLVFGIEAKHRLADFVLEGNLGISRNKGTSLWNFVQNTGLGKILQLHVDHHKCSQVLSTCVDAVASLLN